MNMLAVGNFSSIYVAQTWGEALRNRSDTLVVDAIPLLSQDLYQNSKAEAYILSLLRQGNFELLFFYADGLLSYFSDNFFDAIRRVNIPLITFHADDEPENSFRTNSEYDHRFDMIATCSARAHARRSVQSSAKSIYLPWGYNPRLFHPIAKSDHLYDLVFIGKNKVRGINAASDEDAALRQHALVQLKHFSDNNGIRFAVFGMDWHQHPVLKDSDGGSIDHNKMLEVYSQSKLVFNPGWSFDPSGDNYQTKLRHFEAAGCRVCQISNRNPELASFFQPDKEILFYDDLNSLKECILHYLSAEKERLQIADRAHRRAVREHTMNHRIETLFTHCAELVPARPNVPLMKSKIKQVVIGEVLSQNKSTQVLQADVMTIKSLDDLSNPLVRRHLPNDGWIHLLDAVTIPHILNINYASVLPLMEKCTTPVLACCSIVRFLPLGNNPVQVNRVSYNGIILGQNTGSFLPKGVAPLFHKIRIAGRTFHYLNLLISSRLLLENGIPALKNLSDEDIFQANKIICDVGVDNKEVVATPLIQRLSCAFKSISQLGLSYAVWGARGDMSAVLPQWIARHPARFLGYIDKSLAGGSKNGHPIYSPDSLDELNPDVIFIAATISGPQIFETISDRMAHYLFLPLYDLEHGNWYIGGC